MPWSNQSGGSGGSGGGGGPWGQRGGGGNGGGPWGGGPSGGNTPPDLEEIIRRGQDRLKNFMPGGNLGGRGALVIGLGSRTASAGPVASLDDAETFLAHDVRFHRAISEAAENPVLSSMLEMVTTFFHQASL